MEVAGYIGHTHAGIILYKNVWPKDSNFVERLEQAVSASSGDLVKWNPALVGDGEVKKDYRDCFDVKISESLKDQFLEVSPELVTIYDEVISGVRECVRHYSSLYNIQLDYEEATNFVRYEEGHHFATHADSGFSYSCTVSSIGYLNDNYEGGEYVMPYQDIKFKPEYGDLIVHPSDFIYAHASLPVKKGVKYSAVTMYDYNDRNHQHHMPSSYGSTNGTSTITALSTGQVSSLS
jgi:hypothetical protein